MFQELTMPYSTGLSLEERVERAKRLLADKQAQKAKEEEEKSKNAETERREMGKNIQAMKSFFIYKGTESSQLKI